MQGGRREGAGRKRGAVNRMTMAARANAAQTGELPHEFLLRVARGETIDGARPTLERRIDAAKAAAPYYAARLTTTTLQGPGGGPMRLDTIGNLSNEELTAKLTGMLREPAMKMILVSAGLKFTEVEQSE